MHCQLGYPGPPDSLVTSGIRVGVSLEGREPGDGGGKAEMTAGVGCCGLPGSVTWRSPGHAERSGWTRSGRCCV